MDAITRGGKTTCIEDLKRRILTQAASPGSYFDEVEVSETYGISRPPVREALRQLAGEGYVVLHEKRGAQVAPMTHKTLRNFFSVAPMIYAAIARLAAQHATSAQITRMKDIQKSFRAAIHNDDVIERALMNERFHNIMGEMADNEYLLPSLRRLLIDHTRISMTFYNPRLTKLSEVQSIAVNQHEEFIVLIEQGNVEASAALAVSHWELSRSQMESFVTPEIIDLPLGTPPSGKERQQREI